MDRLKRFAAKVQNDSLKLHHSIKRPTSNVTETAKHNTAEGANLDSFSSSKAVTSVIGTQIESKTAKLFREAEVFLDANTREMQTDFGDDAEAWMQSKIDAGLFPLKKI